MSTRRARIKAVTSLPPRRKNTEAPDKRQETISKESSEKITRSPRTPKSNTVPNQEEIKSPHVKNSTESLINKTTPVKVVKTPNIFENASIPAEESEQKENTLSCTQGTPSTLKNSSNAFASPLHKDSPRKTFASPAIPSPKANRNVDLHKPTAQKCTLTPIAQKINENNELQITENIISKISHNKSLQKSDAIIVNSPIVDSSNDEAMDGIVPLQPATIPKPIEILKSEIISENAVVLFDPIVPLPSPSKIRPKLKPAPRLGIHRRNSVQGSASESEDESRRNPQSLVSSRQRHDSQTSLSTQQLLVKRDINRVRNDSVCSSVSQAAATPAAMGSPVKEKNHKTNRRQESNRRTIAMRRKRENVKREALTMYDLIFYNPSSNPIVPDEEEINLKKANEKEALEQKKKEKKPVKLEIPKETAAPVPQIKLGPKGEIILDEESLVIKQTESNRAVSSVVYESGWGVPGSGFKYKRGPRTAEWSAPETVRFYRALAAIGTDFSLMAPLFPDRTRRELKYKFKKEEKINGAQVDKALRATIQWDVMRLKEEFKEERAAAAQRAEREKERLQEQKQAERERLKATREQRVRRSRGGKALETALLPGASNDTHQIAVTADDILQRAKQSNQRKRKLKSPETARPVTPNLATLALVNKQKEAEIMSKMVTPNLNLKSPEPVSVSQISQIPQNIEKGSLVVLTVNDPSSPAKKMLQTYVAHGPGKLTPVALPATFLNSVVGYMKKNTPKNTSTMSPQIISPSSIASQDSRTSSTSGISFIQSPVKRQRHSSYTITQL